MRGVEVKSSSMDQTLCLQRLSRATGAKSQSRLRALNAESAYARIRGHDRIGTTLTVRPGAK
jgi:hypothetical protein